jgi:3-hydroxyacyl-CoA dehydrogenase
MRLLEVVRGKRTAPEVIATTMDLSRRLKKVGVLVGNCRGFVGNRMFHLYRRESVFLAEEGTPPQEIDAALVEWGMAMGPLAVGDLAGLDVGWRIRKEYRHLESPGWRYPQVEDLFCEQGMFGQKTGAGWYRYDENRRAVPNPDAERIVAEYASTSGIPQRRAPAAEIVERCIYALVNEGARILEEGIALRPVDINIVYIHGYGFPAWRGGPMWYADTVGLPAVLEKIREFQARLGPDWEPAPLLERLAGEGKSFTGWDAARAEQARA